MQPQPGFPLAGGDAGAMVRAHDWGASPVGAIDTWPEALRVAISLLLDSPESMYLVWGPALTFFFNDAYRPILGPRHPKALGASLPELWPDAWDAVRPSVEKGFAGEASRFEDVPIDMARGGVPEQTWWTFSFSPVRDGTGRVLGLLCITNETTERVRTTAALEQRITERSAELTLAEEQLRQSQKMEAVGQLTGGLAHDFNNLLTGMMGSLELLKTRVDQGRTGDLGRYVAAAQDAGQRAAVLTHRLLAFSRRQTLEPRPTDVNGLIAGMEDLIRRTIGTRIQFEVTPLPSLWPVLIDGSQLENALLNLCINARDAMPDGGTITVETSNRTFDARSAAERELQPGAYLSLCVSDTGTGMTPEVIAKAFDPFFTTKPIGVGTGLGLSMIYGFAKQSGGAASIFSEPGEGTSVCLYLPRYLGEVALPEPPADAARADPARQRRVLVIDDEATVRLLVSEVLEDAGHLAVPAATGAAGLAVLRTGEPVDLLITDVGLPDMNGQDVARVARRIRPGLTVLFITGYVENLKHGHFILDPGMHVLTKPFTMDALASRIETLIAD